MEWKHGASREATRDVPGLQPESDESIFGAVGCQKRGRRRGKTVGVWFAGYDIFAL
jgi:hypothetical protein